MISSFEPANMQNKDKLHTNILLWLKVKEIIKAAVQPSIDPLHKLVQTVNAKDYNISLMFGETNSNQTAFWEQAHFGWVFPETELWSLEMLAFEKETFQTLILKSNNFDKCSLRGHHHFITLVMKLGCFLKFTILQMCVFTIFHPSDLSETHTVKQRLLFSPVIWWGSVKISKKVLPWKWWTC